MINKTLYPRVTKRKVIKIQDGDTLTLDKGERVRFFGMDTPETYPNVQPYGEEAKQRVSRLIKEGNMSVHLLAVNGSSNTDKYGRLIRIVFINKDIDLNLLMIREGLAWACRRYLKGTEYEKTYIEAEEDARRERKGLWSVTNPINPEEFRKSHRLHGKKNYK